MHKMCICVFKRFLSQLFSFCWYLKLWFVYYTQVFHNKIMTHHDISDNVSKRNIQLLIVLISSLLISIFEILIVFLYGKNINAYNWQFSFNQWIASHISSIFFKLPKIMDNIKFESSWFASIRSLNYRHFSI